MLSKTFCVSKILTKFKIQKAYLNYLEDVKPFVGL